MNVSFFFGYYSVVVWNTYFFPKKRDLNTLWTYESIGFLFFVEIRRRIKCRRTNIALLLSRTWFGIIRWENNGILSSFFSTLVQLLIHERSHIKRVLWAMSMAMEKKRPSEIAFRCMKEFRCKNPPATHIHL